MKKQVLFIQGAGDDGYTADALLVASLRQALGAAYEIQYPRMPAEELPHYGSGWVDRIGTAVSAIEGRVILAGHSLGASMLLKYLSETRDDANIAGVFLAATPFWEGEEDWKQVLTLREDFADKLPEQLPFFFYHCQDDDIIPFDQFLLYQELIPAGVFRTIAHGGHQLNNDLRLLANDIKSL
jgi:predicted alpha/beta hydrolase family esterase